MFGHRPRTTDRGHTRADLPTFRRRVHAGRVVVAACWALAACAVARAQRAGVADEPARFDGHAVVRITARTQAEAQAAVALTGDVWSHGFGVGTFDVRVPPGGVETLRRLGIDFEVLIPDVQALIDAERARLGRGDGAATGGPWYEAYHPYQEIRQRLNELTAQFPGLTESISIDNATHEGRQINGIRITGPGSRTVRPALLFNGCQHAREWISPATVMYIAERLLEDYAIDPAVRRLVDGLDFIIVPVVNPDGYVYTWTTNRLWRKNRRDNGGGVFGVDLNRNWSYQWGGVGSSGDPRSDLYRGPSAFSEPETAAVRDLILANPRIVAHVDFHSYGQLVLSPWAFTPDPPPDDALFDALGGAMADAIRAVHGQSYTPGQWYSTLYPSSGVMIDWNYADRGFLSWTIELRDTGANGFILPPEQIIPTGQENYAAVRVLAEWAGPIVPGDMNCDAALNAADIGGFILALFDPRQYADDYPDCDAMLADLNADGRVDAADIGPFIDALFQ